MTGAHLHLILNHFPIMSFIIALPIILIGLYIRNATVLKTGLMITVVSGFLSIPTYLSGEPAEDTLKSHSQNFESVEDFIEEHEEAAKFAFIFILVTAAISTFALFVVNKTHQIPKLLKWAVILIHIFTFTVIARTNYLGGLIQHPELRSGSEKSEGHEIKKSEHGEKKNEHKVEH